MVLLKFLRCFQMDFSLFIIIITYQVYQMKHNNYFTKKMIGKNSSKQMQRYNKYKLAFKLTQEIFKIQWAEFKAKHWSPSFFQRL